MNKPCPFSDADLQSGGSPADHARCLLRKVKVGGNVDDAPTPVPQLILDLVGKPVEFRLAPCRQHQRVTVPGEFARERRADS